MRLVVWHSKKDRKLHLAPARVLVNADGTAIRYMEAVGPKGAYGNGKTVPDIIFIREDGWSLGAPKHLADAAFRLWEGKWVFFVTREKPQLTPIKEYEGYDYEKH